MKLIFILGAVVMSSASPLGIVLSHKNETKNDDISVQYSCVTLGVTGKTICVYTDEVSWSVAADYCKKNQMRLAKIDTLPEFNALANLGIPEFINGMNYWVSGRDSYLLSQFRWDVTPNALIDDTIPFKALYTWPYNNCLFFRKDTPGSSTLSFAPCSSRCKIICEAIRFA